MNYYDILEVSPNASLVVIRAAYKSLIQRYHPDKNPNDPAIAEKASLVVQAYEVLSDSNKRAAYDLLLKQQSTKQKAQPRQTARQDTTSSNRGVNRSGRREGRYFWALFLLLGFIVLVGWTAMGMLKSIKPTPEKKAPSADQASAQAAPQVPSESARPEEAPKKPAEVPLERSTEKPVSNADPRIPALITYLSIPLRRPDQPKEFSGRVLFIPTIDVRVGSKDVESAIRHLNNTTEAVKERLKEDLALVNVDQLMTVNGDQHLARLIQNSINRATGADKQADSSEKSASSTERYGVVEVTLPDQFTITLTASGGK